MIFKRIAPAATPIGLIDIFKIFSQRKTAQQELSQALKKYFSSRYVFFSNSGIASFYLILKVLKDIGGKLEVILPAYTAPALILPLCKLGLKPVLCDISLDDFNLDLNALSGLVSNKTLCIVYVYMFGIAASNIKNLKTKFPHTFLIEDCAQAMGTRINAVPVGKFGDIAFFSFNRGKNLPAYGGGCIIIDSHTLAEKIRDEISNLKPQGFFANISIPFKMRNTIRYILL